MIFVMVRCFCLSMTGQDLLLAGPCFVDFPAQVCLTKFGWAGMQWLELHPEFGVEVAKYAMKPDSNIGRCKLSNFACFARRVTMNGN